MKKLKDLSCVISFFALIFSCFVFSPFASAAMVVDGSLSDWGVTPGAYNGSQAQWAPGAGVSYISEDQNPSVDYLNPGWGGQQFDVEALYFKREADIAYFALVTGFPITGARGWGAGDLAIDMGSDTSYEFGVKLDSYNSTATRGNLLRNATWSFPYYDSGPCRLLGGIDAGDPLLSDVLFGYANIGNGHYVYEYGINIALFGAYWDAVTYWNPDFTVHWTMGCGNDALDLHVRPVLNPEPQTYFLLFVGLGLFLLYRRTRLA
ncbi:MAG TPA: hypothetical protein PLO78_06530 [Candidatus Omnitrophota bacterium]|nr:hypothetical protein [Candidatus Omnitrophota bacterium]